jgi:hypothetical protein
MKTSEQITQERGKTHGSFALNALISQGLKDFMRSQAGWYRLTNVQKEALDVMALKQSRILSGQGMFLDHWLDIGGYVELVKQEIQSMDDTHEQPSIRHNLDCNRKGKGRRVKRSRSRA